MLQGCIAECFQISGGSPLATPVESEDQKFSDHCVLRKYNDVVVRLIADLSAGNGEEHAHHSNIPTNRVHRFGRTI